VTLDVAFSGDVFYSTGNDLEAIAEEIKRMLYLLPRYDCKPLSHEEHVLHARLQEFMPRMTLRPEAAAILRSLLEPGSIVGDLLIALDNKQPESQRYEAANKLARSIFSRRYVFHPKRWELLEDAFKAWQGDRSFVDAWADIAGAYILIAGSSLYTSVAHAVQDIRQKLRKSIETDLLGHTLDCKAPDIMAFDNLDDASFDIQDDSPSPLDEVIADENALEASRKLAVILDKCSPQERHLLLLLMEHDGHVLAEIAKLLGISPSTARTMKQRIKGKARAILG